MFNSETFMYWREYNDGLRYFEPIRVTRYYLFGFLIWVSEDLVSTPTEKELKELGPYGVNEWGLKD